MAVMDHYNKGIPTVPSDSVSYTNTEFAAGEAMAVYVGTTGDLTLRTPGGTTLTFKTVPAGVIIPFRHTRVQATGTTATNLTSLGFN